MEFSLNILHHIRHRTIELWNKILSKSTLAMMIPADETKDMQGKVWAEATKTASLLGNL